MKGISIISIKILALYFFVEFIVEATPQIFGIINAGGLVNTRIITGILMGQSLKLIVSLILWYSAEYLSNYIISGAKETKLDLVNYQKIQEIAFSVVSIVLLAVSIPGIVQYFLHYFLMSPGLPGKIIPELFTNLVKVLIALWLLFGNKNIILGVENEKI